LLKNDDNEIFYHSIQTKVLRNESNSIESFKLPKILKISQLTRPNTLFVFCMDEKNETFI